MTCIKIAYGILEGQLTFRASECQYPIGENYFLSFCTSGNSPIALVMAAAQFL